MVWMDDTSLFRGRAYQVMLGTQSVVGTVTDITDAAGHRHAGGNAGARAAHERDRPGGAVAVASGGVRALRQQPRAGRVHPGGPADPQHRGRRDGDRAARGAGERLLAPARRGQGGAGAC